MAIYNTGDVESSRRILSGKDGVLYRGDGTLLANMESYHAVLNVSNQKYLPLGTDHEMEIYTSHGQTLEFTEWVVRDDQFISDLMEWMATGRMPEWNFIGTIYGGGGFMNQPTTSEERFIYPYVVPSGNVDLQNVTSGSLIQRAWSCYVNGHVRLASKLSY